MSCGSGLREIYIVLSSEQNLESCGPSQQVKLHSSQGRIMKIPEGDCRALPGLGFCPLPLPPLGVVGIEDGAAVEPLAPVPCTTMAGGAP